VKDVCIYDSLKSMRARSILDVDLV
jgi:hypothetical protein